MRARFLFGPAGSGKTFRCLSEIREELTRSPEGPDLVLLAPKQATFQLERQLLADDTVGGYSRLHILSFERLAAYVFDRLDRPLPDLLSEEGRVMVLRGILEQEHSRLRVFRASARLSGFARQLSALLRELQRRRLGPESLEGVAARQGVRSQLADKLLDFAHVLRAYLKWVGETGEGRLEDTPRLLDVAVDALRESGRELSLGGLWLDGFAEMTPQEETLLAALLPSCQRATLAFCLPHEPAPDESWLSPWAVVSDTAAGCLLRVRALPDVEVELEQLEPDTRRGRFSGNPALSHVERVMAGAVGHGRSTSPEEPAPEASLAGGDSIRMVECASVEAEARMAARELIRFVQEGGRFRECAVLVRSLESYQDVLRRVFTRYEIPFFLDRREPVAHHPLAELTRFALRTVAYDWRLEDWLGVLKTGLAGLTDPEVDRLENAALSRGWEGASVWLQPLPDNDDPDQRDWLEARRGRVVSPFMSLSQQLRAAEWTPTGAALAGCLRRLWTETRAEARLKQWSQASTGGLVHTTVWEQLNDWVDNLELAFQRVALPLRQWLQIIEAGLSGLSVGVVPPALDQVLVGSVDRSRNPDLKFALVLGLNESVFPAPPGGVPLLSESDVEDLDAQDVRVGPGRRRFGHERYLGYIALTRARAQLLMTWSAADAKGRVQNPSRFVDEIRRALPELAVEHFDGRVALIESAHASELAAGYLAHPGRPGLDRVLAVPGVGSLVERWRQAKAALTQTRLSSAAAALLYGTQLKLSVSALEAFASCPFRFVILHGLRARARDEFEVDLRQTGILQHEILASFHRRVLDSGRAWRELDPQEARAWLREIGEAQLRCCLHGLFIADAEREFQARALLRNLEQAVLKLTEWSRQNDFEPGAVEVSFGLGENEWPAWTVDLGAGRAISVRGRVDRVDVLRQADECAAVAILDYKSGGRRFESVKFDNGLELQMPAYLNAICANDGARRLFRARTLQPAGVFYVGLRARPESAPSRSDAAARGADAEASAFQHLGRFDVSLVERFDNRRASKGDQFKYSFNKAGSLSRRGNDAMPTEQFSALLECTTHQVRQLADRILSGAAEVSPYQQGSSETACDYCELRPVCRFDAWTQCYRPLKRQPSRLATREGDA